MSAHTWENNSKKEPFALEQSGDCCKTGFEYSKFCGWPPQSLIIKVKHKFYWSALVDEA